MKLPHWLNVLQEQRLEDVGFEVDVDKTRPHLDDGEVEHKDRSDERQVQVVINIPETVVLLVGNIFDNLVVNIPLEQVDVLALVSEQ